MTTIPDAGEMYCALVGRDAAYDGLFVAAIRTTGIFCRPTCPARKPRFENVAFFETPAEARRAGFRPCKRCRPEETPGDPPWVRDLIAATDRAPGVRLSDRDLQGLGIEPSRARRYFREHYGMTFQAYHRARRLGGALTEVRSGGGLLDAGLASGFSSASGFRDAFARHFGTPPGEAREQGADGLFARYLETPLGAMLAVAGEEGVYLLEFVDRRAMEAQVAGLRKYVPRPVTPGSHRHLDRLDDELRRYFEGALTEFTVPLIHPGSSFQEKVWTVLRSIPYGQTTSYRDIAHRVGQPGASQAVGRANGKNRLAIVVPCHRVVRSDGHLCGYAGGLRRKEWLLAHERRVSGNSVREGWLFDRA